MVWRGLLLSWVWILTLGSPGVSISAWWGPRVKRRRKGKACGRKRVAGREFLMSWGTTCCSSQLRNSSNGHHVRKRSEIFKVGYASCKDVWFEIFYTLFILRETAQLNFHVRNFHLFSIHYYFDLCFFTHVLIYPTWRLLTPSVLFAVLNNPSHYSCCSVTPS